VTVATWIDTPWWLDYAKVKARGYAGVMRYICSDYNTGPGSNLPQKRITYAEAQQILADGLDYGVNFEDAAQDYLGGYARGLAKGKLAGGWMLNTLKCPAGMSCCTSLDADIGSTWKSPAKDYQKGFADGLTAEGPYVPGVYGAAVAINGAWADNTAHVFWLTAATSWSHGQTAAVLHLQQKSFWPYGSNADLDVTWTQPMGSYLQASGDDVGQVDTFSAAALAALQNAVWDELINNAVDPTPPQSKARSFITDIHKTAHDAEDAAKAATAAVAALNQKVDANQAALLAAIAAIQPTPPGQPVSGTYNYTPTP
jgi:hypothetical protein